MMSKYATYQVSLKVLFKKDERILLLKDKDLLWDLPGGRIDESERNTTASYVIERELREELGKDFKYRLKSPIFHFIRHIPEQKELVLIIVFEAEYISGEIILSEEHEEYQWISHKGFPEKETFFSEEEYNLLLKCFEPEK